jgi:hypothetical protein
MATPYTNDTYKVTFTALDPVTLSLTNTIDRSGVRPGGGCDLTYEEEDPTDPRISGGYINSEAQKWFGSLASMYSALYWSDFGSALQYSTTDIGNNRDNPFNPLFPTLPYVLTSSAQTGWPVFLENTLSNVAYSDFNYEGHGNGSAIGGGVRGSRWVTTTVGAQQINGYCLEAHTNNWRMRKVAVWACYTGSSLPTAGGLYSAWPAAFGIRDTRFQISNLVGKNVGLFFGGEFDQGGYGSGGTHTSFEVAFDFDLLWVGGPIPFPGSDDPTYAFAWALAQTRRMYPRLDRGTPMGIGFPYLPYSSLYDGELLTNNIIHIKTR